MEFSHFLVSILIHCTVLIYVYMYYKYHSLFWYIIFKVQ